MGHNLNDQAILLFTASFPLIHLQTEKIFIVNEGEKYKVSDTPPVIFSQKKNLGGGYLSIKHIFQNKSIHFQWYLSSAILYLLDFDSSTTLFSDVQKKLFIIIFLQSLQQSRGRGGWIGKAFFFRKTNSYLSIVFFYIVYVYLFFLYKNNFLPALDKLCSIHLQWKKFSEHQRE